MKSLNLLRRIKKLFLGSYEVALSEGLIADEHVSIVGAANFGSEPYLIHLHRYCRISMDVMFITHDGGTWAFRNDQEKYKHVIKFGKIEVGEYSFVGARATILPGVTIGDHCVIGAGSLVNHNVPSGTVYAGVPARFICTTKEYAERCLKKMPADFNEKDFLANKKEYVISHYRN